MAKPNDSLLFADAMASLNMNIVKRGWECKCSELKQNINTRSKKISDAQKEQSPEFFVLVAHQICRYLVYCHSREVPSFLQNETDRIHDFRKKYLQLEETTKQQFAGATARIVSEIDEGMENLSSSFMNSGLKLDREITLFTSENLLQGNLAFFDLVGKHC